MDAATSGMRNEAHDEVSLVDLWLILLRHKILFWGVVMFCTSAALVLALNQNKTYLYSTSLEIGRFYEDKEPVYIDSPQTVLSKLQEGYIPSVLARYYASNSGAPRFNITARMPRGSEVIVIESKGSEAMGDTLKALEEEIIDLIKHDHARTIDVKKRNLLVRQGNLVREQEELKDKAVLLRSEKERTQEVLSKLVAQQLASVKTRIDDAIVNRKKAGTTVGDEPRAMTLLMIDNELNQNRNRLAALEERLYVDIPNRLKALDKELADNQRLREAKKAEITQLDVVLTNFRETRAIIEPTASSGPVGKRKSVIVGIGSMMGLVLGIFTVFVAEFLVIARQRLAEEHDTSGPRPMVVGEVVHVSPTDSGSHKERSGVLG